MTLFDTPTDLQLKFHSNYGSMSCPFWDIQCQIILWRGNHGQGSIKVIESGIIRDCVWFPISVLYSNFVPKMHYFWDIRLSDLETRVRDVTQGHRNRHVSICHDFLLSFHSNHVPISYRFQGKLWF